jgi:PAS domain S-box-containing protein
MSARMSTPGVGGVARAASDSPEAGLRPLEVVYDMAAALVAAPSLEVVFDEVLEALVEAAGADRVAVLLLDAAGVLRCEASHSFPEALREAVEGSPPWAAQASDHDPEPEPVLIPDVEREPGLAKLLSVPPEGVTGTQGTQGVQGAQIRALALVPMKYRGRLLGAFVLAHDEPHLFSDDEVRIARTIAGHAALAIERHRTGEALERSYGQLLLALEAGGMETWEWDISSGTVAWSESRERTSGLALSTFPAMWQAFQQDIVEEDREHVLRGIERALDERSTYEMTYRIERPDGELRWVGARGAVAVDRTGCPVQIVGVCSDITDRKRHEDALAVLAEASEVLYSSLSLTEPLEELARLTVPRLADWCVIHLVRRDGRVEQTTVAHADPERVAWARELQERYPPDPTSAIFEVLRSGRSTLYAEITDEMIRESTPDAEQREMLLRLGLRSTIVVPLIARGRALGLLTLVTAESRHRYDAHDLALAEELGRRAGLAIDNARLYEERSRVARTLQERLLPPELPEIPGLELAARYLPAAAEVGGDFYDVFPVGQPGSGRWVLAMGDVCGKGVEAAALTGMIRSTLRAVAMEHPQPSGMLLALNDAILPQLHDRQFFTIVAATLQRVGTGAELTVSCAGHVPPLVVRRSGVERMRTRGTLLGVFTDPSLADSSVVLGPGDALVCFTDGATDQRDADDMGRVVAAVSGAAPDAASVADAVAGAAELGPAGAPRDDVAVLVVRVPA